jgi:hypothetical protein
MHLLVTGIANGNPVFRKVASGETSQEAWNMATDLIGLAYASGHHHHPRFLTRLVIDIKEIDWVDQGADPNFWGELS